MFVVCFGSGTSLGPARDVLQASCSLLSLAGMQQRTSISENYNKRIKLLPNESRDPAWHGHSDSNDNLIINFSEGDDTDSNSEESDSGRTTKDTVGRKKVDRSRRLLQTSSLQHEMLQKRSNNQMKVLPTRMTVGHPSVTKAQNGYPRMLGPTVGKETSIHRHAPTNKVLSRPELGHVSDVNMADDKVRSLRQQIAVRENELRLQKRSIPESKDRIVDSDKHYHANSTKPDAKAFRAGSPLSNLPSSEESKHFKPDEHLCSEVSSDGLSQVQVPGMKSISETKMGALETNDHLEVATRTHQLTNGTALEKNVAKINERHGGSNSSLHVSSVMFPLQVKDKEPLMTSNQTDANPCENRVLSPVKTDINFINDSSHLQLQEQSNTNREVILNWEALNDKELEEAQEIRHKCELEEMRALKAYRKAREALVAANNRCSVLYRRREELSLLASRCLSRREIVPKTSNELLSELNHLMDAEEQGLDQVGYNLQTSGDGLRADQYCKDDVNVRNPENVITHSKLPNVLMNGRQGFLIDNELLQSRTVCQTDEVNANGETVDINVETERSPVQQVHDFELEASLRSKLVARFSVKSTSKSIPGTCSSNIAQESELNDKNEQSNAHIGIVTYIIESNHNHIFFQGASNGSTTPLQDSSCLKESCVPKQIAVFSKPSVMRIVCRHFKLLCPESSILRKEVIDVNFTTADGDREHNICSSSLATLPGNNGDLAIDPFWPLCMFELRGKCNDEECPWQHLKECNQRKSKQADSASFSSDKQVDSSENLVKVNGFHRFPQGSQHNIMSIPTYRIGSTLIKSDAQISQPVLARSMWRYWQIGFCTSFPLPFSVQRILPPEAQILHASDIHLMDNDNWNRPSLYFPCEDSTLVLKALLRALEGDRNSVVSWVVYLQVYYRKEKYIGKDDMFCHAVKSNGGSYELWHLYINSRIHLDDRLDAYKNALSVLCQRVHMPDKESRHISAYLLDLSLQMIDFLRMCGDIDKAISCVYELCAATELGNSNHILLSDILPCLVIPDKCIFLVCCIYLVLYRKLPETIVQKFELEKDLPFVIEWPPAELSSEEKYRTLQLMERAVNSLAFGNDKSLYEENHSQDNLLRSAHFLAISHIKCVATLDGLDSASDLLAKYVRMYPTCIELHLMSLRLQKVSTMEVFIEGFQDVLSMWPKEIPGSQCLWNQYAEYALECGRIDVAEKLMEQWFHSFCEIHNLQYEEAEARIDGLCDLPSSPLPGAQFYSSKKDSIFGLLNLCLYELLQKNIEKACIAVDKALELTTEQEYGHCVREHAAFLFSSGSITLIDRPHRATLELINRYLLDTRSCSSLEPLSRRFYRNIKKPKLRQLISSLLVPVSLDFSLLNSVLKVLHGPSLLPELFKEPKDLVDYTESLLSVMPANYQLALSVCNFISSNAKHAAFASKGIMFWGSSVLANSIFQSFPVAPESVWLEAANVLSHLGIQDISEAFCRQAISVYPFSFELWQSHLNLSKTTGNSDSVRNAAKRRGFELS
ncbi:hypothetical protein Taro_007109 [Colocasia esculenta]|uniref:Putative zinc-finger domain-containing protein n=1 Tax=Colocasia esculenta TaxID=4460 RepID=A0A843TZL1_COLES|nr:hypothetical protein [Colocasia esculenta]